MTSIAFDHRTRGCNRTTNGNIHTMDIEIKIDIDVDIDIETDIDTDRLNI